MSIGIMDYIICAAGLAGWGGGLYEANLLYSETVEEFKIGNR